MSQGVPAEEQELIRRSCAGDINAFEQIYHMYSGMVYSVAYRITNSAPDAEEVTQDTFLAIHNSLKDFRGGSALKTWIYRITVTRALNIVKRSRRIRSNEMLFDYNVDPDNMPNNIDQSLDVAEAKTKADELLSALDPDKRACLTLRVIEGLSYQEISAALGININTVRTRIKRAREFLLTLNKSGAKT